MPRKSAAAISTPRIPGTSAPRLTPPAGLHAAPAAIFRAIVAAVNSGHFAAVDTHLLCQFAETLVLAKQAAEHLRTDGAVIGGKPSPWLAIAEKSWRASAVLASRLRLAPASRYDARAAQRRADRPGPVDITAALRGLDDE